MTPGVLHARVAELAWLPDLWSAQTDRATRSPRRTATRGAVLVLHGPFLLRRETADALDVGVHLQTTPAAIRRRLPATDADRVTGAWRRYLDEASPADRADLVVRAENPDRPALVHGT